MRFNQAASRITLSATSPTLRFSTFPKSVPFTQSLNAPIEGIFEQELLDEKELCLYGVETTTQYNFIPRTQIKSKQTPHKFSASNEKVLFLSSSSCSKPIEFLDEKELCLYGVGIVRQVRKFLPNLAVPVHKPQHQTRFK